MAPKVSTRKPSHLHAITDGIHKKDAEIRTHNARRFSAPSILTDQPMAAKRWQPSAAIVWDDTSPGFVLQPASSSPRASSTTLWEVHMEGVDRPEDLCDLSNNEWVPEDAGSSADVGHPDGARWSADEYNAAEETALSQQLHWVLSGEDRSERALGSAEPAWETASPFIGLGAWGDERNAMRHLFDDSSHELVLPADFYPCVSSAASSDFNPSSTSSSGDFEPMVEEASGFFDEDVAAGIWAPVCSFSGPMSRRQGS